MLKVVSLGLVLCVWFAFGTAGTEASADTLMHDFRGFDDTILYDIDWTEDQEFNPSTEEQFVIAADKEDEYSCLIPKMESKENESKAPYTGETPFELVAGLFSSSICSFRVESYWTYEVCHGEYIKQYHEEREGKASKMQEYILGRWNKKETELLRTKLSSEPALNEKPKLKKVEGLSLPYLAVDMTNGTPCSLIDNKPRVTRVLYVCFQHAKIDVYSVKEVSTCQYEVVILTQVLCTHPNFQPNAIAENRIKCSPTSKATPVVPKSRWHPSFQGKDESKILDHHAFEKVLNRELEKLKMLSTKIHEAEEAESKKKHFAAFFAGNYCLSGGTGFWRYELCFGKTVRQFHKNKAGDEKSVMLGRSNEVERNAWILEQRQMPNLQTQFRKQISYKYLNGDDCPSGGGKQRRVVVVLKCVDGTSNANESVADEAKMYLLEPVVCEYVLMVETPIACNLISHIDGSVILIDPIINN